MVRWLSLREATIKNVTLHREDLDLDAPKLSLTRDLLLGRETHAEGRRDEPCLSGCLTQIKQLEDNSKLCQCPLTSW